MSKQEDILNTIRVLRGEIEVLTSRLRPAGTGILHTAISVLSSRVEELIDEVTAPYWKDEDGDIGRLPGQTKASHLRSVEDGFAEHTEAMESARLREIQDKAAGRQKPNKVRDAYLHSTKDNYEHTEGYYDTQRNRPMEGEELFGLSNRSMKQRYGQAVQTTSEMMQEELEPLPINTLK